MNEAASDDHVSRRTFLRAAGLFVLAGSGVAAMSACGDSRSERPEAASAVETALVLYRQEGCSCCATYADYLRDNGFAVDMKTVDDLGPIRSRYAIPDAGVGCHTSVVDGYVIEGHVPVEAINRVLSE